MTIIKNWTGWIEFLGIFAFFLGATDQLEGCTVIMTGSGLIAWITYLKKKHRRKGFLTGFGLITFGVACIILIPELSGGNPVNWLLLPVIMYPLGWLLVVVLLSMRFFYLHQKNPNSEEMTVYTEVTSPATKAVDLLLLCRLPKKGQKPKRLVPGNM
jgi:hypothetical protein